jgi:hypothetical protein
MTVVVITPRGQRAESLVAQLMPNPIAILAGPRVYHFFDVVGENVADVAFTDLDGEILTEFKTFPTYAAAREWVDQDVARHDANAGRRS